MMDQGRSSGLDLNVSRETLLNLQSFLASMQKWNAVINLVAKSTVVGAWDRHVLDSAQIYSHAPNDFEHWVDLGTGGGFPGVVVAIMAQELNPKANFTFVESDLRKVAFLRQVVRDLSLRATVCSDRIESVEALDADVVSARALASLSDLLVYVRKHAKPEGIGLLLKGRAYPQEILDAKARLNFQYVAVPSKLEAGAAILKVWSIENV